MIWIIGGTSETKELVRKLKEKNYRDFLITVVSEEGVNQIREYKENILIKSMDYQEMKEFIIEKSIEKIIDISHPFADIVSENAKRAAKDLNIEYIRYLRDEIDIEKYKSFDNIEELKRYINILKGNVFFTTGSKYIEEFESVRNDNRFIYRILPASFGINICKQNNINLRDIVAVLGPFSIDFNKAMFKNYGAKYVVMKNSGKSGGTEEKIKACLELGIEPLILRRSKEEGISSIDEILELIL
ncbi:MAG: precorrin-6A reductase [Andreesenia angusta]|nr:precorrin-6A reductase [Andreesenia angusta]